MFFSYTAAFSQLYVKPNGGTDSYIYVTNEILFVEQGVDLTLNPTPNVEASIYLRDGGQLIQGGTTGTANNGTGLLSVKQNTPEDDAYDYTLWCSPVGIPNLTSGNKNFGIRHFYYPFNPIISKTSAKQANYTNNYNGYALTATNDLYISRRWIYTHDIPGTEAEDNYTYIGQGNNIQPGDGFTMKGVNENGVVGNWDFTYDFRGRPNNGSFTYSVDNGMMTLAGNPYPSAIDLAMVVNNNPVSAIWFWDEDRDIPGHTYQANRGGYGTWIPAGGPPLVGGGTEGVYTAPNFVEWDSSGGNGGGGTGGSGDSTLKRRFAPIGQGFMLIGTANSTATIDNSMRVFVKEGNDSNFRFRSPENIEKSISENSVEYSNIWPFLRLVTEFKDSHSREMGLMLHKTSTDGYDHGMDGNHPMDATSEAYFPVSVGSFSNKQPFVIQTVPYNPGKRIPIAFTLDEQHELSVFAVEEINLPTKAAYLWDSENNVYQKITGGSKADLILSAGEYDNRFFIVFRGMNETMEISKGTIAENNIIASVEFFQNNNTKQLEVSNPDRQDIKSGQIFDMSGKLVINKSNIGNHSSFTFSTANLSDGVYLVKLTTVENVDIDYKIVVSN